MAVDMRGKDLVSIHDLSREEVMQILETARWLKMHQKAGGVFTPLVGKTLGMIFHKPSTRTRLSFQVAMYQLGGQAIFLSAQDMQLKRGESIADTARVLSRYLDGIMIRTFAHADVVELARYATIPVINGLTDLLHPCQALSDLFTISEKKGRLEGLRLVYVGDGNNMAHSLMLGGAKAGMHVVVATPPGFEPNDDVVRWAQEDAALTGGSVDIVHDPMAAVRGADVVYTDVWASMGEEAEHDRKAASLRPYQVNQALMNAAGPQALFMHCLPAHRGEEVTDEVIDGPQSVVWDQAENRLHVQKAILALVM